jgi:hypothetical protein
MLRQSRIDPLTFPLGSPEPEPGTRGFMPLWFTGRPPETKLRKPKYIDAVIATFLGIAVLFLAASYAWPDNIVRVWRGDAAIPGKDVTELVGDTLPPVSVLDRKGGINEFAPANGAKPVLLVLFKSSCGACELTAPRWRQLLAGVPSTVRKVALTTEGEDQALGWLQEHRITADELLLAAKPDDISLKWKVAGLPMTLLIDRNGVVKYAREGGLTDAAIEEIRKKVLMSL